MQDEVYMQAKTNGSQKYKHSEKFKIHQCNLWNEITVIILIQSSGKNSILPIFVNSIMQKVAALIGMSVSEPHTSESKWDFSYIIMAAWA